MLSQVILTITQGKLAGRQFTFDSLYEHKRNRYLKLMINIAGVIYNHCIALHRRFCERDASIPKKLADVIDLALVEKPEVYFQTAADLKQALLNI